MSERIAKKDPVVPDQSGRLMPVDPLGINSCPEEVKRKFNVSDAREDVVRQRAYEIYEQHGREEGYALDHWLQAENELTQGHHRPKFRGAQKAPLSAPESRNGYSSSSQSPIFLEHWCFIHAEPRSRSLPNFKAFLRT
jgi:Protein of unknown function (DUF2934)